MDKTPHPSILGVERVGCSTPRLTKGRFYKMNAFGDITDDRGEAMTPARNSAAHWKIIYSTAPMLPPMIPPMAPPMPKTEKPAMRTLKIETHVNNTPISAMTSDAILELVREEQGKRDAVIDVKRGLTTESPALDKLVAKHDANIKHLLELLEQVA